MNHTYTHTYAVLEVSPAAYAEIRKLLEAAGYQHVLHDTKDSGTVLDMHGIALATSAPSGLARVESPAACEADPSTFYFDKAKG